MSETNDIRVTFRGFEGEDDHTYLTNYLLDLLGSTLDVFLPAEPYHLDVRVQRGKLHNNQNNRRFECESVLHIEGERNPIVIRKSSENFFTAAQTVESILRETLTRRTRVRDQTRRGSAVKRATA